MEIIINYALSILSDINFMMAMLIIVLVSACFLGRYIVITRKMVIATLGVLGFRVIFIIAGDILLKVFNPVPNHAGTSAPRNGYEHESHPWDICAKAK